MNVTWVHFPLHPETQADGVSLEELFAGRNIDIDQMYAQMKALMDIEGLPYGKRTHTYNSRLAQELGKWADTQPGGKAFHDAMFTAYFVDAKNISDIQTLISVAENAGLPAAEAESVLLDRKFRNAVDMDWARSREYGITGVPTFVAGRYGVVGAQSYETLETLIEKVRSNA